MRGTGGEKILEQGRVEEEMLGIKKELSADHTDWRRFFERVEKTDVCLV